MESDGVAFCAELDAEKIVNISLILDLPTLLELADEVVVER